MGLGFTPIVKVTGAHADLINSRLMSWELIDASGYQSDQLTLRVDTSDIEGLPAQDGVLRFFAGYKETSLVDKGEYKITRIMPRLFPNCVTIIATAAPFKVADQSEYKKRRSRSFEKIMLGDLFRKIVAAHGFEPRVAKEFDVLFLEHVDQSDETDMSFVSRLAKRYDAVAKPVDNLYVLARRGEVKTISGRSMSPVTYAITGDNLPKSSSFINATAEIASRPQFKGVVAKYWDQEGGVEVEHKVGASPFKQLRDQYESLLAAQHATEAEMRKIKRMGTKIKVDVPGDPGLIAEGIMNLSAGFPSYMQGGWSIDRVISRGSRGEGYRCSVEASEPV